MALNKTLLTSQLQAFFEDVSVDKTPAQAASQLADIIDAYVKTATVNISTIGPGTFANTGGPVIGVTSATGELQ